MTDVKRLLDEATPLPWRSGIGRFSIEALAAQHPGLLLAEVFPSDGRRDRVFAASHAEADLIVHAVNALPDYEAAVDALDDLSWDHPDGPCWCLHSFGGSPVSRHGDACKAARAALARLRGKVPA